MNTHRKSPFGPFTRTMMILLTSSLICLTDAWLEDKINLNEIVEHVTIIAMQFLVSYVNHIPHWRVSPAAGYTICQLKW